MIASVVFKNFKALENYTIHIKDFNILVGSNNNGKSTILDAFRALQGAYRYAQRYKAKIITLADCKNAWGYDIPNSSLSIPVANVQTNFSTEPALITFKFRDGQLLHLEIAPETTAKLYFDHTGKNPRTPGEFKKAFPLNLAVIPTLGPFESTEDLLNNEYLKRWHGSRIAPRMFRNYWHQIPELFDEFKELVERTWPGMSIQRPSLMPFPSKELVMFYEEQRIPREVCWAGFGFQIWLQLLTHIIAAKDADLLVVDEPEIYLHPDLQHKILEILKRISARVLLATHSIEIINNAEPSEVFLVDKKVKSAKRLSALSDLQNVASILGSSQNVQLTRLARGKRILFVEGKDAKLLGKFARLIGLTDLFTSGNITVIPIDGFSHHTKITNTSWAFSKVLGEEIKLATLLDRDYRSDDEVRKISESLTKEIGLAHILRHKEIENYLLIPDAIERSILERLKDKSEKFIHCELDVYDILNEATEYFKRDVQAQLMANKWKVDGKSGKDSATIFALYMNEFEKEWVGMPYRLGVVSGKKLLSKINEIIQERFKVSITAVQVINNMRKGELDVDLMDFLERLNKFSNT